MTDLADASVPDGWRADFERLRRIELARGAIPFAEWLILVDRYGRPIETIREWFRGPRRRSEPFQLNEDMLVLIGKYKNVKEAWRELHASEQVQVGYTTFFRGWQALAPAIRIGVMSTIREARKKQVYGQHPTHGRNSLWYADATMADNYVLPCRGTKPFRSWHQFILDADTRRMWMAVVDANPDAETQLALIGDTIVGETLDDGTFFGGIPGGLGIDNGRDYLAEIIAAALGRVPVPVFPGRPYEPFGKGKVERAIGTYIRRLGTTTPGYVDRPGDGQRDPWHPKDGRLLTFDEYVVRSFEVLDWYNNRPHSALGGKSPNEAWREQHNPIFRIDSDKEEDVASLFLRKSVTRRVSKNGVRFRDRDYFDVRLLAHVGEEVQLGFYEHDPSFLHLFQGNRWLFKIHPVGESTREEMGELVGKRHKQLALVRRVKSKAAKARSSSAPGDRDSSSKVTRGKPARPVRSSSKGKSLLHSMAKKRSEVSA